MIRRPGCRRSGRRGKPFGLILVMRVFSSARFDDGVRRFRLHMIVVTSVVSIVIMIVRFYIVFDGLAAVDCLAAPGVQHPGRGRRRFAAVLSRHVLVHLVFNVKSFFAKMAFELLLVRREMVL